MPLPVPKPTPEPGPQPELTGELVDPPFADVLGKDPAVDRKEEVGVEEDMKIISRYCVICGKSGGFWMLSSIGKRCVSRGESGVGVYRDVTIDNYFYHVKGYVSDEPQQHEIKTIAVSQTPMKYAVIECRLAK
jgi:hypothetical protein